MKYIKAEAARLEGAGVSTRYARSWRGQALVNERLLMQCSPQLEGTLEERVAALGGELLTREEAVALTREWERKARRRKNKTKE